ncbi:MAG: hypothetical protein EOM21_21170 [Gammaproteobacteria bacterium]|nr:hypothetical protein [Gammaproteobacteria bacterium]
MSETHHLYQPTEVVGSEFTRCYQMIIDNRMDAQPVATFAEERVLVPGTGPARRWPTGQCSAQYDPDAEIPILDPSDGSATGATITMSALYGLLYSAYLWAATARDAAQSAIETEIGG